MNYVNFFPNDMSSAKACSVQHCPNGKSKNIPPETVLHPLPEDLYFQKQWLKASGRKTLGRRDFFAICQLHFEEADYEEVDYQKTLKSDAIPSVNLPAKEEEEDDPAVIPASADSTITRERYNLLLLEYELLEERIKRQRETLIALKTENSALNDLLKNGA